MAVRVLRITASLGLTLCLGLAFMPLGCGGSNAWSTVPGAVREDREEPPVPAGTFAALMACVTEAKGRLSDTVYTLQFNVEVDERGEVVQVKLRDSLPKEPGMEACLGDALAGMTLPRSALARMPREKAVSPAARGLTGQVWEELFLIGGAINLAPIFLATTAVTVTVIVGVKVTTEAIDATRRRRKRKEQCIDMFTECKSRGYPCDVIVEEENTMCEPCMRNCINNLPYKIIQCTQCGFR